MNITVTPTLLKGELKIIPSKSQAHRMLICAAFADSPTVIVCQETNRDIEATADCLRALGASIVRREAEYRIYPVSTIPNTAELDCCESGSTLRFMLPIVGALGVDSTFLMKGRLPNRPLSPLWEEMERMGCHLSRPTGNTIRCTGKLKAGRYTIDGGVSSQYITGLLLALSLIEGDCSLEVTGKIESRPYIELTKSVMRLFGVDPDESKGQTYRSPGVIQVEGDWSNGAFWLAANIIGSKISILGLSPDSVQGDREAERILSRISCSENAITVCAGDIPDLVPILSIAGACRGGIVFKEIRRLRLKESDRVASICAMLKALGGDAEASDDTLTVYPCQFTGGTVDACNDHRIAMSAAIAATVATGSVTILGAECVTKSYPKFWEEYKRLGGIYEQYLR